MRDKLKFYFSLLMDFLNFSFVWEFLRRYDLFPKMRIINKSRKSISSEIVKVLIHEWGGYAPIRTKQIKNKTIFTCGLEYQLMRFLNYKGNYKIELTVSLSDIEKYKYAEQLNDKVKHILPVSNMGYDFSGYSSFLKNIKGDEDSYIILANTSVNAIQTNFIDDYIEYMNKNLDVGILGVSYSTKCFQSLIPYNFHPHLQSFFLLTTKNVLDEIVEANGGKFPGVGIMYKLLLIREGEIKLSEEALKLGYALGVVLENGSVFKFKKENIFYNGYHKWKYLQKGDMRQYVNNPNVINELKI